MDTQQETYVHIVHQTQSAAAAAAAAAAAVQQEPTLLGWTSFEEVASLDFKTRPLFCIVCLVYES